MTYITPVCAYCTHFFKDDRLNERCEAFPQGIPEEILSGQNNHKFPVPGDHGILFEPVPGYEEMPEMPKDDGSLAIGGDSHE